MTKMLKSKENSDTKHDLGAGSGPEVPAGTWYDYAGANQSSLCEVIFHVELLHIPATKISKSIHVKPQIN